MTRTKPSHLIVLALLGGGLTWLAQVALAASGNPVLSPPVTVGAALLLIGVVVIVMALPVRRVARGVSHARVDPFYATRVVTLAKASSLSGALLAGAALAITAYLLTRSVAPGVGSVTMALVMITGSIVLLVAGLVAEHMCAIPPKKDDRNDQPTTGDPQ